MVVFSLASTFGVFAQKAAQVDLQRLMSDIRTVGSPESSATTPRTTTFTSPVYTWAREHEQLCGSHTHRQPTWPSMWGTTATGQKHCECIWREMERYTDVLLLKILIFTCVTIKTSWFIFMQMLSQRFRRSVKLLCADTNGISKPQTTLG